MPDPAAVPDGWQAVRLGDVLTLEYGVSLPERDRLPGPIPVVGSAGVVGVHDRATNTGPGVIVGRKGSIGAVTWVASDFIPIDTTYYSVPVGTRADLRWIYHVLTREDLAGLNRATGVPGLSRDDVYALRRPVPPLAEQRAIAAVLDAIDEAIERTEEVIAATERLRDALLHELLTRGLPGRHSEWADVPGLGTVPACWDVVRLGEVADVQTGRAVNRKSPRNGNAEIPYLSVANVKDGYLDLNGVKTMLVSPKDLDRYGLRPGDVLFTEGGDADKLGRGTVWQGEIEPCLHQNHVFAVRPHDDLLLSSFLSASASSDRGRRYFLGAAKQTTNLASINSTQLKSMPLPLPTLPEQRAIDAALGGVDGAIERAREERGRLHSLQASAADALLTGRVRVASETLER